MSPRHAPSAVERSHTRQTRRGSVRRAWLALMVFSRLWSTTTLTPAILTGGLAAPAAALALPPAGGQTSSEGSGSQSTDCTPPSPASTPEEAKPNPGAHDPSPPECATESTPTTPEAPPPTGDTQPPTGETPPGTGETASGTSETLPATPPAATPPPQQAPTSQPPPSGEPSPAAPEPSPAAPAGGSPPTTPAATAGGAPTTPAPSPSPAGPGKPQAITAQPTSHAHVPHTIAKDRRVGVGEHANQGTPPTVTAHAGAPTLEGGQFGISAPMPVPNGLASGLSQPPAFLIDIYKQAGRRYDVPWRVLAAINSIETDYGADLSVSSAGAIGWMQFMPETWRVYGDGGNPYDPHDAIFAAARLLSAAGASHDLARAIFAYNHAGWYVAAVLWRAGTIDVPPAQRTGHERYALPLEARYMRELGRTDDGVDIETPPDGAPVYSITPGVVVAVASDPTGFGPDYPVILATSGPLQGSYIYYGHVAASLVTPGQHVTAGQPIAIVGHTGDAADLGHGHIEIGFCDSSGDPLDHHGVEAWTPAGEAMRWVLVSLSNEFGISNS